MWTKKVKVFISKYAWIFTNSGVKTKKRFFISKTAPIFTNSWVKPQKKGSLLQNLQKKKTVLAHDFWGDNQYFGSFRPRTALQCHRACFFLWGTILAWGTQAVIWGAPPRNVPRGVGPDASLQQYIELQLSHFRIRDTARNQFH